MLRFDIINYLIQKNNYQSYLEIGVEDGHSLHQVKCKLIHSVDPASKHASFEVTSDEFFKMLKTFAPDFKYDIIFIDGLHVEDQVDRDIENAVRHLSDNGTIVVHDCNPPTEWHQRSYEEAKKNGCRQWNGTVWKSIVKARASRPDLDIKVVNTDWGCGIIRKLTPQEAWNREPLMAVPVDLKYEYLEKNRIKALNLITNKQFLEFY